MNTYDADRSPEEIELEAVQHALECYYSKHPAIRYEVDDYYTLQAAMYEHARQDPDIENALLLQAARDWYRYTHGVAWEGLKS